MSSNAARFFPASIYSDWQHRRDRSTFGRLQCAHARRAGYLLSVLESLKGGVLVLDRELPPPFFNRRMTELTGALLEAPKARQYHERIRDAAGVVASLVNNYLDVSRIEAGQLRADERVAGLQRE